MSDNKKLWWVFVQPFLFVALLWAIFGLDLYLDLNLYQYSLLPRDISQWFGVFTFPLIHGGIDHIAGNTWSIFILLAAVRYFFPQIFGKVFWASFLLPGVITFFIARPSFHLGASGMVYSLVAFLFFSGVIRLNRYLLALSMLMVFLYGNSVWYIFPIEEGISWEGHLSGGIIGLALAIVFRKSEPTVYVKEKEYFKEETSEDDPIIGDLWKPPSERKPAEEKPQSPFVYVVKKENKSL
jgi:membrane associated rhomboid family serine protease